MTDTQLPNLRVANAMKLVDEMSNEELNMFVDYIRESYKARARRRNIEARMSMQVGTRVRLEGNRKPQYLSGLTGEVVEMRQSRVVVKLDCGPVGKFKSGKVITAPGGLTIIN